MSTFEPTAQAVRQRCERILSNLTTVVEGGANAWLRGRWRDWNAQLQQIAEESKTTPRVTIALVGGTGAGKSTLLNALLGTRLLPVSNMRACTAAISEVSYALEDRYTAEVTFISRDSWRREMEQLRADIADAVAARAADMLDAHDETPGAASGIARAAVDKVKAVYELGDDVDLMTLDFDRLVEPRAIAAALDEGMIQFGANELEGFRKSVESFLSSRHSYWPIVKTVTIRGPFEALRCGATLVDLPGINDPNEAREEVTKRYLKECRFVWIVFNIKRALTKDIQQLMQSDDFLRQIVMDGRANALTLIGTASDDVDTDSGREEFHLHEDASDVEVIAARNAALRREVGRQLDEMALRLANLAGENRERADALAETFKGSHIFTVSARECLRLEGVTRTHSAGLEEVAQSEVPQLRAYMDEISVAYGPEAHAAALHRRIDLVLMEITNAYRLARVRLEHHQQESEAHMKEVESAVGTARGFLDLNLKRDAESLVDHLEADEKVFRERLRRGVERAQRELSGIEARWSAMHWCTLRATVRRHGTYTGSTGHHDLAGDLTKPILDSITFAWADFFGDRLTSTIDLGMQKLLTTAADYNQRLAGANALRGADRAEMQADLETILKNTKAVLAERLGSVKTQMRQRIEHEQRTLHEAIYDQIKANMVRAFDQAAEQSGPGMKARMVDILRNHAREVSDAMFGDAEQRLTEGVRALNAWLGKRHAEMCADVGRHAEMMEYNLKQSVNVLSPEALAKELRYLDETAALAASLQAIQTTLAVG